MTTETKRDFSYEAICGRVEQGDAAPGDDWQEVAYRRGADIMHLIAIIEDMRDEANADA